jgi:hypothetical protein
MTTNDTSNEKSIVAELEFDSRTSKRVAYSEWEFTIVGPFEIEVRNASYGPFEDEHTYRVMIDERGIPVSCSCKGFQHHHGPNGRVGKHMLAVAAIGGPTLLDAAAAFSPHTTPSEEAETETIADRLKADGGSLNAGREPGRCPNGNDRCDGPGSDGLPCFACYCDQDGATRA